MTIFRASMTAIALVCFTGAILPAAGQDARRQGKTAHHSTHPKKRTHVGSPANPAAPRTPGGQRRMDGSSQRDEQRGWRRRLLTAFGSRAFIPSRRLRSLRQAPPPDAVPTSYGTPSRDGVGIAPYQTARRLSGFVRAFALF
jgi:hypothetical protein